MTLAIAVLVGFTGFALSVTHKGTIEILNDKAYKDFRLVDYSNWLPQRVNDDDNWKKIKSCLSDKNFCTSFGDEGLMTSLKSGCCKPLNDCKFTYEGPIKWNKTNGVYTNPDCSKWENSVETLYYNCQSCKAGVIDQVKRWWTEIAVTNAIFLGLLIFFYLLGCCACCNNRSRKNASHMYNTYHNPYYYAHKGGPPGP
ncbi:hypothetical protein LWI29_008995 [Acer saccharum]|uniref:Uncharacterized protein n=1 Tax=Acer saccharum TaxID=4024 RepID=A0AA39V8W4_ACESA|nr:hypothetical protein LWI29_008995 [Acer saccharum]